MGNEFSHPPESRSNGVEENEHTLFLSKFSKRDFTVHQHLLVLALRELGKQKRTSSRYLHAFIRNGMFISPDNGIRGI